MRKHKISSSNSSRGFEPYPPFLLNFRCRPFLGRFEGGGVGVRPKRNFRKGQVFGLEDFWIRTVLLLML